MWSSFLKEFLENIQKWRFWYLNFGKGSYFKNESFVKKLRVQYVYIYVNKYIYILNMSKKVAIYVFSNNKLCLVVNGLFVWFSFYLLLLWTVSSFLIEIMRLIYVNKKLFEFYLYPKPDPTIENSPYTDPTFTLNKFLSIYFINLDQYILKEKIDLEEFWIMMFRPDPALSFINRTFYENRIHNSGCQD